MENMKILVVEDENIVVLDIKNKLKTMGFNVLPVISSGEEAIEMAHEHEPDLILMDIMLDGKIDGIEAAQEIVKTLKIPVIYLTANTNERILERTRQIGSCSYIIKPFYEKELENTINTLLKLN